MLALLIALIVGNGGGRARAELLHTAGYDIAHVLLGTAAGGIAGVVVYRRS